MARSAREVWAERVARLRGSGLGVHEFASQIGVNPSSLSWWRWQLSRESSAPRSKALLARRPAATLAKSTPALSPLTFVEMTSAIEMDRLEVVLPSSVRVRVRPGFDRETLGQLLDVLEARR